ncbi:MAG TPA: hypothetical protein VFD67_12655 [Gemmatimonadaceae bacterium]|nr:hypothetical protein [Gemmatimonadaceae bacterium]
MPRTSDPRRLLRKAIDATGLTDRQFARTWLFVGDRTLRYWVAGEARIPAAVLIICHAIIDGPVARRAISRAVNKIRRSA